MFRRSVEWAGIAQIRPFPVPTLSECCMIAIVGAIMVIGAITLRRQLIDDSINLFIFSIGKYIWVKLVKFRRFR